MFAVLTCIFAQHDLRLVVVAALICVTAACAAFVFQTRGLRASGSLRWAWLALTGLVAGSGVWATHFLAMLAYQPTLRIGYEAPATVASLAVCVLGMGLGFSLPAWRRDTGIEQVAGAITGASIVMMHYMGIDAIRAEAHITWNMAYVFASVVVSIVGAVGAFSLRKAVKGRWAWAPPAGALVVAIVGLHFTAMTAVILTPDPSLALQDGIVDRNTLAIATAGLAALVLSASLALVAMERVGQRGAFDNVRGALDAVPSGLAFYDAADRLRVWNQAFAALMSECGTEAAEGVHRRAYIEAGARARWFATPDEDEHTVDAIERSVDGRRTEFNLPDGRCIRHESHRTADGGGVTILTDITSEKRSAAAMSAARDAAEAANRAKSEFLANMSHEIRTPLNGVLGIAEALQRTELGDEQSRLVGVIQNSGRLLNGLLGDLLDLARVEAGALILRKEPSHLGQLVRSVEDLYAAAARDKGLVLRTTVGPNAEGRVDCDPQRLAQILGNLVSNAIKFTDAGQVAMQVERDGDRVRFIVRDTGVGFDEAERVALFQRFGQADSSMTRKHGGAGLGLALCAGYLREMASELACESVPGRGSAFTFDLNLPLLDEADSAVQDIQADQGDGPERFNVLVVDDNPVNRQVLELILDSVGLPHTSVADGLQAVEAMMGGDFDAVLMDIQMPVMDGLEATRRIREWEHDAHRHRAPIVIVSANGLQEHVDAGRAAGADAHLCKPISAASLLIELETQRLAVARREAA